MHLLTTNLDPVLLVLSSDHLIKDSEKLHESIKVAKKIALQNKLVALGVVPSKPETGYGYIKVDNSKIKNYYNIIAFKEKPNHETAIKYLDSMLITFGIVEFLFLKPPYILKNLKNMSLKFTLYVKNRSQIPLYDFDFIRIDKEAIL